MSGGGWRGLHVGLLALLATSGAAFGRGPEIDASRRFLASAFQINAGEVGRLNSGQIISRTLPVTDPREIATFGAVRMKLTPEFFVAQMSDIVRFKQGEAVAQIGVFSQPPEPADVHRLTLEDVDVRSLTDCRVGDCGVQLPAEAIARLRKQVDWRRPDAGQQANAIMRQMLVAYAAEYQRVGAAAPMRYADQKKPLDIEQEFASLASANGEVWRHFPSLQRHLFGYPDLSTGGATDVVYWSKEKVGRKPVVSVTHLAIVRVIDESPADYAVASKHLYGSHYFDASLGLTVLMRDSAGWQAHGPGTYVIYLNRSRVDVFGGLFGGMIRKIVTSRARGAVADQLERLRHRLEGQFASQSSSSR